MTTSSDLSPSVGRRPRFQPATNGYAGAVPAWSLVRCTAVSGDTFTINRPSADNQLNVLATGPAITPNGGAGLVSGSWPLPVVYAGAAPAIGDERGTAADSFQLTAGKTGFAVVAVDTGRTLAWIVPAASGGAGPSPYTSAPANLAATPVAGTAVGYSYGDHQHGTPWTVGDVKLAMQVGDHTVNGHVWKLVNGRTIGDASSGAGWASADALALFTFLWNNTLDVNCPVTPSGRGASAAADWAAHKKLAMPNSTTDGGSPTAYGIHPVGAGGVHGVGEKGGAATHTHAGNTSSAMTGVTVDAHSEVDLDTSLLPVGLTPVDVGPSHTVQDAGHAHGKNISATDHRPPFVGFGFFILAVVP